MMSGSYSIIWLPQYARSQLSDWLPLPAAAPAPRFSLDARTGWVTLQARLDYELMRRFTLTVLARDGGGEETTGRLRINVLDVNDNPPVFQKDSYMGAVRENEQGPQQMARVRATDEDSPPNNLLTYSITFASQFLSYFSISMVEGYAVVMVNRPLDYELVTDGVIHLIVMAKDGGNPALNSTVPITVEVFDENDNPPEFSKPAYIVNIPENIVAGPPPASSAAPCPGIRPPSPQNTPPPPPLPSAAVCPELRPSPSPTTATITTPPSAAVSHGDICERHRQGRVPEFGQASLIYSLQGSAQFRLNTRSGEITTTALLDREQKAEYILIVRAVDGGVGPCRRPASPRQGSSGLPVLPLFSISVSPPLRLDRLPFVSLCCLYSVNVTILDINDNAPVWRDEPYEANVVEMSPIDTDVITTESERREKEEDERKEKEEEEERRWRCGGEKESRGSQVMEGHQENRREDFLGDESGRPLGEERRAEWRRGEERRGEERRRGERSGEGERRGGERRAEWRRGEERRGEESGVEKGRGRGEERGEERRVEERRGEESGVEEGRGEEGRGEDRRGEESGVEERRVEEGRGEERRAEWRRGEEGRGEEERRAEWRRGEERRGEESGVEERRERLRSDDGRFTPDPGRKRRLTLEGCVLAVDPDYGENGTVLYSISPPNPFYRINSTTGKIRTRGAVLDRESRDPYTTQLMRTIIVSAIDREAHTHTHTHTTQLMRTIIVSAIDREAHTHTHTHTTQLMRTIIVSAIDRGTPPLQSTASTTVYVNLLDLNDNDPAFVNLPFVAEVPEGLPIGSSVYRVLVEDPDEDVNGAVTLKLEMGMPRLDFALNISTGILSSTGTLDRERIGQYYLRILAYDAGKYPRTSTSTLTITVLDVNDETPTFFPRVYNVSLQESVPRDYMVVPLNCSDNDAGLNAELSYFITGGNQDGKFSVGFRSGVVRTVVGLDRETQASYTLVVEAIDNGPAGSRRTGTATVYVEVLDVNDNRPIFLQNSYETSVIETAPQGTSILQVHTHTHTRTSTNPLDTLYTHRYNTHTHTCWAPYIPTHTHTHTHTHTYPDYPSHHAHGWYFLLKNNIYYYHKNQHYGTCGLW
ncbi:hypothetical protein ACEWY4_020646 [Coilia grayii]|uniref:Cadherin domain-containing protein n=1 Tax=Coilia grayii TaxID=363190 RepID=A0ABD1J6R3_9TELE